MPTEGIFPIAETIIMKYANFKKTANMERTADLFT